MDNLEIRYYIGKDRLSRQDLTVCARVCKLWCKSFLPLIYRIIDLRVPNPDHVDAQLPPISSVRKHGCLIRHLTISLPTPYIWELSTLANHILTLNALATRGQVLTAGELNQLTLLLTNNKSLRQLRLAHFYESDMDSGADSCRRLVQVVSEASTELTELSLDQTVFSFHNLLAVIKKNKHLKVLSIDHIGGFPVRMPTRHAEWLVHAPHIKSLTVNRLKNKDAAAPAENKDSSVDQPVSRLNSVKIRDPGMSDDELSEFLDKSPYLTELSILQTEVGIKGFEAMARLFGQLTVLDLEGCKSAGSWICWAIMQSCPQLIAFACPKLVIEDHVSGFKVNSSRAIMAKSILQLAQMHQHYEPDKMPVQWACTCLKRLRVHTLVWPSPTTDRGQKATQWMATLSQLENLEVVNVRYIAKTGETLTSRIWRKGIFESRSELLKSRHLQWMVDLWPNLKRYQCVNG